MGIVIMSGIVPTLIPPGELPNGYTKLAYIESHGNELIDTGLKSKSSLKFQLKHMPTAVTGGVIAGAFADTNDCYRYFNYNSNCYLDVGNDGTGRISGGSIPLNEISEIEFANRYVKNLATDAMIISGTEVSAFESTAPVCLNGYYGEQTSGKYYYFKVYDGSILVRNFIPCINPSGEYGMYDTITKQFYGNVNLMETVNVTGDNIGQAFTVTNSSYYFNWVATRSRFVTTNGGINSSTALTTLTALFDMNLSFTYTYSSESSYDKFTLKVGTTTVANALSGSTTTKTYSGTITKGTQIVFQYVKDSSQHKNDDECTFYNMVATPTVIPAFTGAVA